jgi:hypothetical protein
MKIIKIGLVLLTVYVGIVVIFESLLGYFQPQGQTTLIITTVSEDGQAKDRVLQQISSNGQIYVAANHWPRAWYHKVLEQPNVKATIAGKTSDYKIGAVTSMEYGALMKVFAHPIWFRILTGFPPREFVRLDPNDT